MKTKINKRSLSGIFFMLQTDDGREPVVFEDLPESEQDRQMENRSIEWLKSLAKQLTKTLREVGDTFDIAKESHSNEG